MEKVRTWDMVLNKVIEEKDKGLRYFFTALKGTRSWLKTD